MLFKSIPPSEHLSHIVKEFWIIENSDPKVIVQKIIPDGYCEIIFHYGDPYRIKLIDSWKVQSNMLFAGQISKYFYLQNTGSSGMMGIKLLPTSINQFTGLDMSMFTDTVVELQSVFPGVKEELNELVSSDIEWHKRIELAENWLFKLNHAQYSMDNKISNAVNNIIAEKGMIDIEQLVVSAKISRRHFEREFKKSVGLTPKFFSRIIRFNYIFECMKEGNSSWVDIAYNTGYFDQSHFIKNFKEFTGEEPSKYGFNEQNMANFFLKK